MNLPTQITLSRFVIAFAAMALLFLPGWQGKAGALGCFAVASLTDWLDGFLARRWNQMSPLGALLDPIADKVLVLGMFLAFVQLNLIPAWMVLIIVLRESLITGVRLYAASRQLVLAAAKEGKQKTVSQMVTILLILTLLVAEALVGRDPSHAEVWRLLDRTVLVSLWVTMVLTVVSGAVFFWRHRSVLRDTVGR